MRTNSIYLTLIILLGSLYCMSVKAQSRADEIRNSLLQCDQRKVMVVAHRGDWRYAPENSIPAVDNAIRMGVEIIEIDIQRTKDGQLILMHDSNLDRTTTGRGNVSDCTLDYVKSLNLKNGCAIRTKEKVPTLEEVLIRTKGKVLLNLDKADHFFEEVFRLAEKTGTTNQLIMKGSKSPAEVKEQFGRFIEQGIIYMPIVNLDDDHAARRIEEFMEELKPVAFELLFRHDSNKLPLEIARSLSGKSLIWYNTLWDTMAGGHDDDMALDNPDAAYGYLIDSLGTRIIQTDRPQYLIDYLRSRNLHE